MVLPRKQLTVVQTLLAKQSMSNVTMEALFISMEIKGSVKMAAMMIVPLKQVGPVLLMQTMFLNAKETNVEMLVGIQCMKNATMEKLMVSLFLGTDVQTYALLNPSISV